MKFNKDAFDDMFYKKGKDFILERINSSLKKKFDQQKQRLLDEVVNHPISVEIQNHSTPSTYLNGVNGSLFAFIGFEEGSTPIQDLTRFLNKAIRFIPATTLNFRGQTKVFMVVPRVHDFDHYFPLPWEPGISWISGIEEGISGLGHFLAKKSGRSMEGIEIKGNINQTEFSPVEYLTPLLQEFKEGVI